MSGKRAMLALLALILAMTGLAFLASYGVVNGANHVRPYFLSTAWPTSAPAVAAPSKMRIVGDLVVKQHRIARLSVEGAPAGSAVVWDVTPEDVCDVEEVGGQLRVVGPPGTYAIRATAFSARGGKTSVVRARARLVIEASKAPAPPPPPGPTPNNPLPPVKKADPVGATIRIAFGQSGCTATIIGPARADGKRDILTAAHCIPGVGAQGMAYHKSGRKFRVKVVSSNRNADLAWLVSLSAEPALPMARIASTIPPRGTPVWHNGYGWHQPRNVERGTVRGPLGRDGKLPLQLRVSSGDSGGGIFRQDTGELVAAVCCSDGNKVPGRGLLGNGQMWGGACTVALKMKPKASDEGCPPEICPPAPMSYMAGEASGVAQDATGEVTARCASAAAGGASVGLVGGVLLVVLRLVERWLDRRGQQPPAPPAPRQD